MAHVSARHYHKCTMATVQCVKPRVCSPHLFLKCGCAWQGAADLIAQQVPASTAMRGWKTCQDECCGLLHDAYSRPLAGRSNAIWQLTYRTSRDCCPPLPQLDGTVPAWHRSGGKLSPKQAYGRGKQCTKKRPAERLALLRCPATVAGPNGMRCLPVS